MPDRVALKQGLRRLGHAALGAMRRPGPAALPRDPGAPPTWSVHATVDEPLELLCAYVAHYLKMGASEVHLFLDRPNPHTEALLTSVPGVRVTVCDAAYWGRSRRGRRPEMHTERQLVNVRQAYAENRADWFLFCDADEFIHMPTPLAEVLGRQGDDVDFMRFRVAERAFRADTAPGTIFDGVFRPPMKRFNSVGRKFFGDNVQFLNRGLLGHSVGKSILRRDRGTLYTITHHFPKPSFRSPSKKELLASPAFQVFVPDAWLVHFDGLTSLHWAIKLLNNYCGTLRHLESGADAPTRLAPLHRATNLLKTYRKPPSDPGTGAVRQTASDPSLDPDADLHHRVRETIRTSARTEGRQNQILALVEARNDPERSRELLQLPVLSRKLESRLRRNGHLFDLDLDPSVAARALFPNAGLDYSVAAFDAKLRELHADLLAKGIGGQPVMF